jgi:ribose 5-phosphate isomerase A
MTAADYAVSLIEPGMIVGLGTGRAATAFVKALGPKVRAGLDIHGVPTSESTAELARLLGIPLLTLADAPLIDITFDGADEVDPQLRLIKGYGGAMVREMIVAAASKRLIILVGPEKLVPHLGTRGLVPIEVLPFALAPAQRAISRLGYSANIRQQDGKMVITDNHNLILDVSVPPLGQPERLEQDLLAIPGVVGTGLFLGMAESALIDDHGEVRIMSRA